MRWLLVIPAIPVVAWLGLWVVAWFQPAVCLACGHEVRKGNERYDCPGHGEPGGDNYINGEWIDPDTSRGFNLKPTDATDPVFRFHRRGE